MESNSTLIQNVTPEELSETFRQIVREELAGLKPEATSQYLTRKEVCKLLKISLPTLSFYTKKGIVNGSRVGTRILYDEATIREAVKQIPILKYKRESPAIKKALC